MTKPSRVMPWDGRATGKCDYIGCPNRPILHIEFTAPGSEYGAEADLCETHIPESAEQARAFVIALGLAAPSSESEQNLAAVMAEHIPEDED